MIELARVLLGIILVMAILASTAFTIGIVSKASRPTFETQYSQQDNP